MSDERDQGSPQSDEYLGQREATSDDRRIPNDGELVEVWLIPGEMLSGKTTTLRLTLQSGTIWHLRAKEEVCLDLHRELVRRFPFETEQLLASDPTSPLYRQKD